jgi:WD40 repeat protein
MARCDGGQQTVFVKVLDQIASCLAVMSCSSDMLANRWAGSLAIIRRQTASSAAPALASCALPVSPMVAICDGRGGRVRTFGNPNGDIWALALSPDGKTLLTANRENVQLWDFTTGQQLRVFSGYRGQVWALAFAPDGNRFAAAGEDQMIHFWNVATGEPLSDIENPCQTTRDLAFTPNGLIACALHRQRALA